MTATGRRALQPTTFAHGAAAGLLGAGLGVQVFLSFLVAPAAFRLIDRADAVRLMEGVFPGYYRFGLVVTAAALVVVILLAWAEGSPSAGRSTPVACSCRRRTPRGCAPRPPDPATRRRSSSRGCTGGPWRSISPCSGWVCWPS
jgi:hypothetical protein